MALQAIHRLPPDLSLGPVRLVVSDIQRSIDFYTTVLGLRIVERGDERVLMGTRISGAVDGLPLVELREERGATPVPRRGRLGLFHFAILLPDRASLGSFALHLASMGIAAGAGDHLVSEALYLHDPDNLGIEIYVDRPRDRWRYNGTELVMTTEPVDMDSLVREAGERGWDGMPAGTVMGHVHLHVGALQAASAFYSDALGFDRTVWSYPGALFMSAGGYHHHLGVNIWAGSGARAAGAGEVRLAEWTLELHDAAGVEAAAASLERAKYPVERMGTDVVTQDPWGTRLRLRA